MSDINVHVTVDAKSIINDVTSPSKDPTNPTSIGHQYSFMVISQGNLISGNGTGDLKFSANVNDSVRFSANSTSNNYEEAVLIYKIKPFNSTSKLMNHFIGLNYTRQDVFPSGTSVLPANKEQQQFPFYQGVVTEKGKEDYEVWFVLYTRDTKPGSDNSLSIQGFYKWDPTVIVD